jgi:hypothetical protein
MLNRHITVVIHSLHTHKYNIIYETRQVKFNSSGKITKAPLKNGIRIMDLIFNLYCLLPVKCIN